jgi:pilus assembly protein CpaB
MGVIFGVAVVCALLASYLVVRHVRQQEELARVARIDLQTVLVATSDIPVGTRLTTELVAARSWPKTGIPEGAVSDQQVVLGRLVKAEIRRAEPIFEHRLFPKDMTEARGVMSVLVPPGKRAMTVGVNEVIGVSGFILPKDRVDVIATRTDDPLKKTTETILQSVEVLAAGHRLEHKGEQYVEVPTVTMAVTPSEAERVALALNEGKIHIVLRSIMDTLVNGPLPVLRASSAPAGLVRPRGTVGAMRGTTSFVVDVIRGDKRTAETYPLK